MNTKTQISLIIIIIVSMSTFKTSAQSAEEIIKKSQEVIKVPGQEAVSTLEIYDNKGRKRVRKTFFATKLSGDTEKRFIKFLSPADVEGTTMLIYDYDDKNDDMWIYMPALRKTRRIVSSEKGKSFMGSEFSNADLAAQSIKDFSYKLLGEEEVEGILCWKIEEIPIDEDIAEEFGFSKKITWVEKSNYVMRRAVFYDLDDEKEMWKELMVSEIQLLDEKNKKYFFKKMIMGNHQNKRTSIMIMDKVELNPNLKDEYFTTDYIER